MDKVKAQMDQEQNDPDKKAKLKALYDGLKANVDRIEKEKITVALKDVGLESDADLENQLKEKDPKDQMQQDKGLVKVLQQLEVDNLDETKKNNLKQMQEKLKDRVLKQAGITKTADKTQVKEQLQLKKNATGEAQKKKVKAALKVLKKLKTAAVAGSETETQLQQLIAKFEQYECQKKRDPTKKTQTQEEKKKQKETKKHKQQFKAISKEFASKKDLLKLTGDERKAKIAQIKAYISQLEAQLTQDPNNTFIKAEIKKYKSILQALEKKKGGLSAGIWVLIIGGGIALIGGIAALIYVMNKPTPQTHDLTDDAQTHDLSEDDYELDP